MRESSLLIVVLFSAFTVLLSCFHPAPAQAKTGVIVVDIQGDFTTWKQGSLAVPGTDEGFIKKVEEATRRLAESGFPIFATQDWHPADHISFYSNHPGKKPFEAIQIDGRTQVLWPPHCVQGTENAKILLDSRYFLAVVRKGQNPQFDSYSGFQDDGGQKTEMDSLLRQHGIRKVIIYGIATDYCVKATALDALANTYQVIVIEDLCKGVAAETSTKALEEMKQKGAILMKELDIGMIVR
ncbi:MAG: bifunctional nicotinamidase/pyrazinamidase [candidate division NC10 bacterium]|nr:bifunctional nicotinamidase/pyrazinamidase [candidate division NC10 bacterium]